MAAAAGSTVYTVPLNTWPQPLSFYTNDGRVFQQVAVPCYPLVAKKQPAHPVERFVAKAATLSPSPLMLPVSTKQDKVAKVQEVCFFYMQGICNRAEACRFVHPKA